MQHKACLKITQILEAKSGANLHMISQQSADEHIGPVLACLYHISVFNAHLCEHTLTQGRRQFILERNAKLFFQFLQEAIRLHLILNYVMIPSA